jgi:hypothetical protein
MKQHMDWSYTSIGIMLYAYPMNEIDDKGNMISDRWNENTRPALMIILPAAFTEYRAVAFEGPIGWTRALVEGRRTWVIGAPRTEAADGHAVGSLSKGVPLPEAIRRCEDFVRQWFEADCSVEEVERRAAAAVLRG